MNGIQIVTWPSMNAKVGNSGGPNPQMRTIDAFKTEIWNTYVWSLRKDEWDWLSNPSHRTDKGFLGNLSPMQFRYCKLSAFIKVLLVLKVSEANILIYQIEWVTFGCVDYSECQPRCRMKRVIEIWIQLIILLPLLISAFYDLKVFKWPEGTQVPWQMGVARTGVTEIWIIFPTIYQNMFNLAFLRNWKVNKDF